jgi:predicted PurR-regulated permease PerM
MSFSWQNATFFLLTVTVLVFCALLLHPFFSAIVGAIAVAIVTRRPYDWLLGKIRNPNACAGISVFLVLIAIVIPTYFLGQELMSQAFDAVNNFRNEATQQKIAAFIHGHPDLGNPISSIDFGDATRATAGYLGRRITVFIGSSIHTVSELVIMLFILFFLYRDRLLALTFLRSILPLHEDEATELLRRLDDTIIATALGRVVIAVVQGILAGVAYWFLGVSQVVLLTFTTTVAAFIPAFGTVLVWAPVALYLGFTGHWGKAAALALWGGVVVSTIDNFLYPVLIGSRIRSHTVAILLSILGGVALFGVTGIILGPVTFTAARALLDFWHKRTAETIG